MKYSGIAVFSEDKYRDDSETIFKVGDRVKEHYILSRIPFKMGEVF